MNKKYFEYYQYIAPVILTPLSFMLWWQTYDANLPLTLTAWLIPILYAYIVPGVGTNILKVWEFDTRFRLGKFRPHHGFIFGSATSMIAWLCYIGPIHNMLDVMLMSITYALVLGVINIVYDIQAIRSGMLRVYNQPWADGKDAKAITLDYAPWFFAGFGAVYGTGLGIAELLVATDRLDLWTSLAFMAAILIFSITVPVFGYRYHSFKTHGHSGCRPIMKTS